MALWHMSDDAGLRKIFLEIVGMSLAATDVRSEDLMNKIRRSRADAAPALARWPWAATVGKLLVQRYNSTMEKGGGDKCEGMSLVR